jgi:hypothetical protein
MGDDYSNCAICNIIHYDQGQRCGNYRNELCPECSQNMIAKYGEIEGQPDQCTDCVVVDNKTKTMTRQIKKLINDYNKKISILKQELLTLQ